MSTPGCRVTIGVRGRVQGVGFRWWVQRQAAELGLRGWAANLPDGSVEVVAEGTQSACQQLLDALRGGSTPGRVTSVSDRWTTGTGDLSGFTIR